MAKVFLDCGAHKFEGLREFIPILALDKTWVVHSFEANPTITKNAKLNVDEEWKFEHYMHDCAVGARNGKIKFISEYRDRDEGGMGSRLATNWHDGIYDFGGGRPYEVDIINFPEWIRDTFNDDDEVVIKLDVEGAEFEILPELIKDIPKCLKVMWIEWHERFFPDPDKQKEDRERYTEDLRKAGVVVNDWI